MIKSVELLDRWVPLHNTLIGYVYGSKHWPNGTRVQTDALRFVDPINMEAEDLDTRYKLGLPGTVEEHNQPVPAKKPGSSDAIVAPEQKLWLNPRG